MLLNKVLFVSLLVLGLFYIQPAQFDQRLNTRLAGGFQAQPNQFPYVVLITYLYTDSTQGGIKLTYQGTGTIYGTNTVITSANAVQKFLTECNTPTGSSGLLTVAQGVTKINTPAGALVYQVPCSAVKSNFPSPPPTTPTYFGDAAFITVPAPGFTAVGSVLRLPTSSPTAADINNLWVIGYGESFPSGGPNPQLTYIPINPMRNRLCDTLLKAKTSLGNSYSFAENFCLLGQKADPRTGGVTDACVLDAGAPVVRTGNITASVADFEVVGWVNFGTCTAAVPVIATYIFKYTTFFGAQVGAPAAGSPANPRAFDGNFACGDGIVGDGVSAGALEKCDPDTATRASPELLANSCCDQWTCQFKSGGSVCSLANNGTKCKTQPICTGTGKCKSRDKLGSGCGGKLTRCTNGKCCNTVTKTCV